MMPNYKEIIIEWSEKIDLNESKDVYKLDKKNTENVLYQIYGDSQLYGRDVLLYIGISIKAKNRFKGHLQSTFGPVNNISVSIGEIKEKINLEIPESILIANHKPSMNKEFIHDISPDAKKEKIIIINNGKSAMLKTCCTNYWWLNNSAINQIYMLDNQFQD